MYLYAIFLVAGAAALAALVVLTFGGVTFRYLIFGLMATYGALGAVAGPLIVFVWRRKCQRYMIRIACLAVSIAVASSILLPVHRGALRIPVFVAVSFVLALLLSRYAPARTYPGSCRRCGYDLTGNQSGVCPECGTRL